MGSAQPFWVPWKSSISKNQAILFHLLGPLVFGYQFHSFNRHFIETFSVLGTVIGAVDGTQEVERLERKINIKTKE